MLDWLNLMPDWANIITKAWSIRLLVIAAILQILELVVPALESSIGLPPMTFKVISAIVTIGAFYARLYAQKAFR